MPTRKRTLTKQQRKCCEMNMKRKTSQFQLSDFSTEGMRECTNIKSI